MKITLFVSAALLVGGLAVASAEQAPKKDSKKPAPTRVKAQTGTSIPRTVNLNGRITDGPYQLVILTEENIRRSGASTVMQALTRLGGR